MYKKSGANKGCYGTHGKDKVPEEVSILCIGSDLTAGGLHGQLVDDYHITDAINYLDPLPEAHVLNDTRRTAGIIMEGLVFPKNNYELAYQLA